MEAILIPLALTIYFVPYLFLATLAYYVLRYLKQRELAPVLRTPLVSAALSALLLSPAAIPSGHNPMIYPYVFSPFIQYNAPDFLLVNTCIALVVFITVFFYRKRSNKKFEQGRRKSAAPLN